MKYLPWTKHDASIVDQDMYWRLQSQHRPSERLDALHPHQIQVETLDTATELLLLSTDQIIKLGLDCVWRPAANDHLHTNHQKLLDCLLSNTSPSSCDDNCSTICNDSYISNDSFNNIPNMATKTVDIFTLNLYILKVLWQKWKALWAKFTSKLEFFRKIWPRSLSFSSAFLLLSTAVHLRHKMKI